jgi:hypothetical protein
VRRPAWAKNLLSWRGGDKIARGFETASSVKYLYSSIDDISENTPGARKWKAPKCQCFQGFPLVVPAGIEPAAYRLGDQPPNRQITLKIKPFFAF